MVRSRQDIVRRFGRGPLGDSKIDVRSVPQRPLDVLSVAIVALALLASGCAQDKKESHAGGDGGTATAAADPTSHDGSAADRSFDVGAGTIDDWATASDDERSTSNDGSTSDDDGSSAEPLQPSDSFASDDSSAEDGRAASASADRWPEAAAPEGPVPEAPVRVAPVPESNMAPRYAARMQPFAEREEPASSGSDPAESLPPLAASESSVAPEAGIGPEAIAGGAALHHASEAVATTRSLSTRRQDDEPPAYSLVQVYYGTDRRREATEDRIGAGWFSWEPTAIAGALALLFTGVAVWTGWKKLFGALALVAAATMPVLAWFPIKHWYSRAANVSGEPSYGNERGTLEVGVCDVTIPPRHREGAVESPSILRLEVQADAARHVTLRRIEPLGDEAFYSQLQTAVSASPRGELLVFVHGYNVTFDDAVRRTAQIAFDLRFAGASVCYSWPSQGGLLKYTVDETNVAWTAPHLKQFLLAIVARSGARSINLIAHSMGNRALTSVLRDVALEMRDEKRLFNQVVLAAPDIDAEVFKHDIAPAMLPTAHKFTLYASSDDQALRASRRVHGYARAGDSGEQLVVVPGIETIDVSGIDTSLLGHSYYASNDAILSDLRQIVHGAVPAGQRAMLSPATRDGLPYWVLRGATALRNAPSP